MARPDLRRRWDELLARLGLPDDGLFDDLVRRYGEPHRRYHTVEHLAAVVDAAADLGATDAVLLAAWFHDAVYDPRLGAGGNERSSADLAVEALAGRGAPAALVDDVRALVLATIDHRPPVGLEGEAAVLLDADLSILAAPPATYARYAAAVREEFSFVPDEEFRAGRARILAGLLERPLFRTPEMRRHEPAARRNVERELAQLG